MENAPSIDVTRSLKPACSAEGKREAGGYKIPNSNNLKRFWL
jgi:hypothetical protein